MLRPLRYIEARVLPRGWFDAIRQLLLFFAAYQAYQIVRGLVASEVGTASWNATKIIDLEHTLKIFIEPSVQAWAQGQKWLIGFADWMYLNSHFVITVGGLVFLYLFRN